MSREPPAQAAIPTLATEALEVSYPSRLRTIAAVRGVGLRVAARECVGLVGESGSGKTQLFMAAMGLLARNAQTTGSVRFEGEEILGLAPTALNRIRGSKLTMVFQDPMTSLTPHVKIGVQLAEVLVRHRGALWHAARRAALQMLDRVRVPDRERRMQQYPHELSGGMRQRVMIGMSLLCEPSLLIADEPTSALDVSVQAQIVELLRILRAELGMSIVLISHDLGVVGGLADRIAVMYAGRIVESADARELMLRPRHPYTALLIQCVPNLHAAPQDRMPCLPGHAPSPEEIDRGCAFAPRCARAASRCREERPELRTLDGGAQLACHFPLWS